MKTPSFFSILATIGVSMLGSNLPAAVTLTWTGGFNTTYSTANNWVGGVAPANSVTTNIVAFTGSPTANMPTLTNATAIGGVQFGSTEGWTFGGPITVTLTLGKAITAADGTANVAIDASALTSGVDTISPALYLPNAATLLVGTGGTLNLTGGFTGTTLTVGDASNAGTLQLAPAGTATDFGLLVVLKNGTLDLGATSGYAIGGTTSTSLTISGGKTVVTNAAAQFRVSGGQATTPVIVNTGTLDLNGFTGQSVYTLTGSGGVVTNSSATAAILIIGQGSSTGVSGTYSGNITGNLGITYAATAPSNTQTLSGNNTYTGATTAILNGGFKAGSTTGFSPNSEVVLAGSSFLDLNGFNNSVGSLSSASGGVVQNGTTTTAATATLTTGGDNTNQTYAGLIENSTAGSGGVLGLTKVGSGTQTLTGSNTYSGGTTVSAGVLIAVNASGSATGSGTLTVSGGAALGGSGTTSGSNFSVAGSGTTTATRANVLAGMSSATDTNTTKTLTMLATSTSTITNANLTFNLDVKTAGSGTELAVGNTAIAFGTGQSSVQFTLNLENEPAIVPNGTQYVLIAGTLTSGGTGANGSQYSGLTLGTVLQNSGGITETIISGNNLQVAFGSSIDQQYYGANSYLVLYQNTNTHVDDIDVIVVPEPSVCALVLGGMAFLVFWQRRRSQR